MTAEPSYSLFSERIESPDGADTTSISLSFKPDGGVQIDGCYSGPQAEKFWGDWDHEFWLTVPASHAQAFLAALARDAFTRDGRLTFSNLRTLCIAQGIPIDEGHWT